MARDNNIKANVIIGVIIAAVLGLGIYATAPQIAENIANRQAEEEAQQPQTVQTMADARGLSVEEFVLEYGLPEGTTGETAMSDLYPNMTVRYYAKLNDQTPEELLAEMGIAETGNADMTMNDATNMMPAVNYFGGEEALNQMKEMYGIGDEVQPDTPMSEANPIFEAAYERMMAESATEAPAESAAPADGEATEAPADSAATEAPADTAATEAPAAE